MKNFLASFFIALPLVFLLKAEKIISFVRYEIKEKASFFVRLGGFEKNKGFGYFKIIEENDSLKFLEICLSLDATELEFSYEKDNNLYIQERKEYGEIVEADTLKVDNIKNPLVQIYELCKDSLENRVEKEVYFGNDGIKKVKIDRIEKGNKEIVSMLNKAGFTTTDIYEIKAIDGKLIKSLDVSSINVYVGRCEEINENYPLALEFFTKKALFSLTYLAIGNAVSIEKTSE